MRNRNLLFIVPLLWICALLLTQIPWLRFQDPQQELRKTAHWISKYQEHYKHLPWSLADLRLHAKALDESFSPYDRFGLRLLYIPLNETSYLLKSFGSDASDNTFGSKVDDVVLQGVPPANEGVTAKIMNESLPQLYQASFLEGLKATATGLIARLEVNTQMQTRYLLVQDPTKAQFTMLSFHDGVEEFIWLPSGHELIFTAQGSSRYEDGIYYWNLKRGETHNILTSMRSQFWPRLKPDQDFYLALSHVSLAPPMVYLWVQPALETALEARSFYRFKNFYAVNIDADIGSKPSVQPIPANMNDSAFDYYLDHLASINFDQAGNKVQRAWETLLLKGGAEGMIDQWQNFCSQNPQSPMLPYALWWLASIYNDTFRLMQDQAPDEAQVIRNYGIEIADALASLQTAPNYLRAMGEQVKKSLLLSHVADYSVSSPTFDP